MAEEVVAEGGWELAKKALPWVLTAMQIGGGMASGHYGGRQMRRQQEENKRAEARAAMISALTGQRAISQPEIIQSPGANYGNAMANMGAIGMNVLGKQTQYMPRSVTNPSTPATPASPPPASPSLTPMPSRISGGVYNPIPQDWDRITRMLGGI
jgi:hypothetical protein